MRLALRILLPVLVLVMGAQVAKRIKAARTPPKKVAVEERGALVEALPVQARPAPVEVLAQGRVMAARSLGLTVQVGGEVVEMDPGLVAGGRLAEGTVALKIDRRDYDAAVEDARARVAQARMNLDLEQGRRSVAKREWDLLGKEMKADDAARARVLREPQAMSARATLEAAQAAEKRARLNAGRTRVDVPFNALVLEESVEVGQVLGPGAPVARLVGTDAFWVQVSVPVADLDWIQIPGARATVRHVAGPRVVERTGQVVRLLGDLDPRGSMARVLVEIPDPLGLQDDAGALLLGAFVDVSIEGRGADKVFSIPRVALREANRVWLVDADDRLAFGEVEVLRRMRDTVLVSRGLRDGDRLVTSRLASPVPGTKLRMATAAPEAAPRAELPRKPGEATE